MNQSSRPSKWSKLPKVELHRHLDCSIRPSTLRELLTAAGVTVPADPKIFATEYLVKEPMNDLGAVLKKFLAAQKALSSEEVLTRVTIECIEDAVAEGIRIMELRYAPTFIQDGHEHLSFEKIHRAIVKGVQACRHLPIAVGLIAIVQRIKPVSVGASVIDFAIEHKDTFVAVDLADNEDGFDPEPFAPLFQKARAQGLHVTIHAGEAPIPTAAHNVRTAIERLGAERIGHGLQIANGAQGIQDAEAILAQVVREGITLELCPTSNLLTNAVRSIGDHPFQALRAAGVPVTVNTDDPGVFDYDLTHEYDALHAAFGYGEKDFIEFAETAARASFIPLAERQRVWPGL
ncbi:MAG: adenosine deaminase [Bdellovibrionales bacterium]|jgi:adenosine deaminase|nr:adenosine deaminase [Bdellovibrionales bacterium]